MKSPVVFVVDQNQIHRNLIKYHLNVNKFENVHVFQSGEECLYRLQKGARPDFIISDYDQARQLDEIFLKNVITLTGGVKVVYFAAFDDPLLALRLLESGASDYVVKTSKLDIGIRELIKNIKYLIREVTLTRSMG